MNHHLITSAVLLCASASAQITANTTVSRMLDVSAGSQSSQTPAGTVIPTGFTINHSDQPGTCTLGASLRYTDTPTATGGIVVTFNAMTSREAGCDQSVALATGALRVTLSAPFSLRGTLQISAASAVGMMATYSVDVHADGSPELAGPPSSGSANVSVPVTLGTAPTPILIDAHTIGSGPVIINRRREEYSIGVQIRFVPDPGRVTTIGSPCGFRTLTGQWGQLDTDGRWVRFTATGPGPQGSALILGIRPAALGVPPTNCRVLVDPLITIPIVFGNRGNTTTAMYQLGIPGDAPPFDLRAQYLAVDLINNLVILDSSQVVRVQYP